MYDNITMEEYYEAVDKKPILRKKMVDAKYKLAITRELESRQKIRKEIEQLRKEIVPCILIEKIYKESRGIKDEKHKTR